VFVHERVKEWSAKLETFSGPIVIEVLDDDEDEDEDDDEDDDDGDDGDDDDDVVEL
jgi:hypothetical protein